MGLGLGTRILLKVNVITIRNHDFSKGSTWSKCSHWPNQMFNLTQGMEHEKHVVLWFVILTRVIFGPSLISYI
jgi:hypothetical protein